jgi:Zn-dependent protease
VDLEPILTWLAASLWLRLIVAIASAVALHELGHVLFGRIVGIPLEHVAIGEGQKLLGWRMGSTDFSIHAIPLSGYVEHGAHDAGPLRCAVFAAGGIIVNLAVGLSCLALYLFGELPYWTGKFIWPFALAHLALAAFNLVPRQFEDGNKSDGLLIWEARRKFLKAESAPRRGST